MIKTSVWLKIVAKGLKTFSGIPKIAVRSYGPQNTKSFPVIAFVGKDDKVFLEIQVTSISLKYQNSF